MVRAPGTIPPTVNPPHGPVTSPDEPLTASLAPAAAPATRVASAAPSQQEDGFFSSLARKVGLGGADTTATTGPATPAPAAKPKTVVAKRNDAPPRPEASIPKGKPEATKQAAVRPPLKPTVSDSPAAATAAPPANGGVVAGSQPIVQANSFESRFSAVK
jgi:hypothetical protein